MTISRWVETLYTGLPGFIEVTVITAASQGGIQRRRRLVSAHYKVEDMDYVSLVALSDVGADVYLGCATVGEIPERGRGTADPRMFSPGVWLDLDIGDDGHKASEGPDTLRPFSSEAEAWDLVRECGLPEPGAVIRTGGGIHAWWLIDGGLDLRTEQGAGIVAQVNTLLAVKSGERGIQVDMTADPARMLRVPGTMNWKLGSDNPREVDLAWIKDKTDIRDLESAVESAGFSNVRAIAKAGSRRSIGLPGKRLPGGIHPATLGIADATAVADWDEYLLPAGWRHGESNSHERVYERPGKTMFETRIGERSAVVFADRPEVLVVFSSVTGLPSGAGQKLTKLRVAAHLAYDGSVADALRGLTRRATTRAWPAKGGTVVETSDLVWPSKVVDAAVEVLGFDLPWIREQVDTTLASMPEGTQFAGVEGNSVLGRDPSGLTWRAPLDTKQN